MEAISGLGRWSFAIVAIFSVVYIASKVWEFREHRREVALANDIAGMPVVLAEKEVDVSFIEDDVTLHTVGRIDEVRRAGNGCLIVGDIKTRSDWRVRNADVFALSLYAYFLLMQMPEGRVAEFGYIRFINPYNGREKIVPVSLYGEEWVEGLLSAYMEVRQGMRSPTQVNNQVYCQGCDFAKRCYRLDDERDGSPLLVDDGFDNNAPGWSIGGFGI